MTGPLGCHCKSNSGGRLLEDDGQLSFVEQTLPAPARTSTVGPELGPGPGWPGLVLVIPGWSWLTLVWSWLVRWTWLVLGLVLVNPGPGWSWLVLVLVGPGPDWSW